MYTAFASVYDRLMADVDYPEWAGFYHTLLDAYGIHQGKVCECACGTGAMTILLAGAGYQMTGVDASADMLFEASQKARQSGAMIPFVKQDMRALRLHRQMDAVLCTNDGINYLPSENDLSRFFLAAYQVLRPGGALLFDISTPYKLEYVLGNHFWGNDAGDITYMWQNHFSPSNQCVDLDLSIFIKQENGLYQRIDETQRQHAYSADTLQDLLESAGFEAVQQYADKRYESPAAHEERWHFAARKPFLLLNEERELPTAYHYNGKE